MGGYRLFLALVVVFAHLASVPNIGGYAVFGFYMISGYLMTLVMKGVYGYSIRGVCGYALNRFLRIYPAYWVSIGVSIVLIYFLGQDFFSGYRHIIALPENYLSWLRNIFIVFPSLESPRLTPPAWALTVEIFFYIAIGLSLSRNKMVTWLWFLCSALYHILALSMAWGYESRYFPVWAASLPFPTGALVYHYRDFLKARMSVIPVLTGRLAVVFFVILFFANWWLGRVYEVSGGLAFYTNYVICLFALIGFALLWHARSTRYDALAGSLSYPVYLLHYQVGAIVIVFFDGFETELRRGQILFFLIAVPFVLLAAYLMVLIVERPVEGVRTGVKSLINKYYG